MNKDLRIAVLRDKMWRDINMKANEIAEKALLEIKHIEEEDGILREIYSQG